MQIKDTQTDKQQERAVLDLLKRVPDEVVLAAVTDDMTMWSGDQCLCGTFLRECFNAFGGSATALRMYPYPVAMCAERFGGARADWAWVYYRVTHHASAPIIERAFVRRLDLAVRAR